MSFRRPFCLASRMVVLVGAAVSTGLASSPQASATDHTSCSRAQQPPRPMELSQERLLVGASFLDGPVALHLPRPGLDSGTRQVIGRINLHGAPTGRVRALRQTVSARPTVTIITPEDEASVHAGALRVRGTVHTSAPHVRVLVNGVRALVKGATFSARVPVTPNTMILTAVATTARGATARHQIGLTVGCAGETDLSFHPLRDALGPSRASFPLLSFPAGAAVEASLDNGEKRSFPYLEGVRPSLVQVGRDDWTARASIAVRPSDSAGVGPGLPAMALEVRVDGQRAAALAKAHQGDVNRTAERFDLYAGHESETESQAVRQRGFLVQVADSLAPLRLVRSRDGVSGVSLRGTGFGNDYSFVVLFIFDAGGSWRVWWF